MTTQSYRLRLGAFVLISLGLLAGMVLLFGGLPAAWTNRPAYRLRFPNAPGVAVGTPVRKSGIRIGEVTAVELDDATGQVVVDVRIDAKHPPRAGDEPTIARGLFVNDTSIDLIPAQKAKPGEALPAGTEIAGAQAGTGNPVNAVQDLMPEVQKSLEQMRRSLAKLEELAPKIDRTLEDYSGLAKDVRKLVPDVQTGIAEFNRTNKALQDAAGDARTALKTANTWIDETGKLIQREEPRVTRVLDNVATAFDNVGKLIDDETRKKVTRVLDNVASAFDNLGQLLNDENRKQAAELLKSFNETAKNLQTVVATTEEFFKATGRTLEKLNGTLANADVAITEVRRATKPLGDRMEKVSENVEVATRQLALVLTDVRSILGTVSRSEGSVSKFLNDPTFYNNLNQASIQFMQVIPRLDRVFKDLEVFADKVARHPESLGVNGVLHPSTGFKDAGSVAPAPAAGFGPLRIRQP